MRMCMPRHEPIQFHGMVHVGAMPHVLPHGTTIFRYAHSILYDRPPEKLRIVGGVNPTSYVRGKCGSGSLVQPWGRGSVASCVNVTHWAPSTFVFANMITVHT